MVCTTCDYYDVDLEIHGPRQLARIVGKVQDAVRSGRLRVVDLRDNAPIDDLPEFVGLDLSQSSPDWLDYCFECPSCGLRFELSCETYHGSGGRWGRTPPGDQD